MAPITTRLIFGVLAIAQRDRLLFVESKHQRPKLGAGMTSIAKRLILGSSAAAPLVSAGSKLYNCGLAVGYFRLTHLSILQSS